MTTKVKEKTCRVCKGKFYPKRSTLEQVCGVDCAIVLSKQKGKLEVDKKIYNIPKVSKKRQIEQLKYSVLRIEFLGKPENKVCPITNQETTDVHHKKGRCGELFLNTKYWIALSREGHKKVEENPIWATENGYSLSRL